MQPSNYPLHLSFFVNDLARARQFYAEVLGCTEGRSAPTWIDFNLHGNQLSVHLLPQWQGAQGTGTVDGKGVPMPHFGSVLPMDQWQALATRLQAANVNFILPPQMRFKGEAGEQATLFIYDPSGNALEFKGFRDSANIFKV